MLTVFICLYGSIKEIVDQMVEEPSKKALDKQILTTLFCSRPCHA